MKQRIRREIFDHYEYYMIKTLTQVGNVCGEGRHGW
jgi:hypothetical protein